MTVLILPGAANPTNCKISADAKFNLKALEPLRRDLEWNWPSFTARKSEEFWKYQFEKHGSCAVYRNITRIRDSFSYFDVTLRRSNSDNITSYLEGVNASNYNPINFEDIKSKLEGESGYHHRVQYQCKGKRDGWDILQEIRLCFDELLLPINCPDETATCTTSKIWYLKNGASSLTLNVVAVSLLALLAMLNWNF